MAHDDQKFPARSGVSAFGSLALDVVSVLNARQAGLHANQAKPYARNILDRRLMSKAYFNPADALDELRALRLSDDAIIDHYIPDAARKIGERWVQNELGFAEVTIASVRLQSLLTEIEFMDPDARPHFDYPLDVMIVACEGEQHTLGCFVAAAQLRRRGATVETVCGEADTTVRSRILSNGYDAVLFSSSRSQDLETISRTVIHCREQMSDAPVFALGGIILNGFGNLKRLTGVDLATNDVGTVVAFCEQRSERHLKQAAR